MHFVKYIIKQGLQGRVLKTSGWEVKTKYVANGNVR